MTDREKLWQLQEGWRPPHELERGRPRPVRYTAAGIAAMVFAVLLAAGGLALGVGIYVKATKELERARQLESATGRTEARVTRLWRSRSGKESRYLAAWEFPAGGKMYTRTARLSARVWRTLKEGDRREVHYVESNPQINLLEGLERPTATPFWVVPIPPVLFSAIAFFIARDLVHKRRLLEDGRGAAGMVTRLGSKTDKGQMVHYEFLTLGGSRAGGQFGPLRGKALPALGTPLTVIYDPDNPSFNRRYPLSVVRAER